MENTIKKILYVGSRDTELVRSIQTLLTGRADVAVDVMDRIDIRHAEDRAKEKVIKWQEKDKMSDYISNPFNVKAVIAKGESLYNMIKELKAIEEFRSIMNTVEKDIPEMSNLQVDAIKERAANVWDGWFVIKDCVEATTMSYKQAKEVTDLLFAFGFLAYRETNGVKYMQMLLNYDMQLQYIALLKQEKLTDIAELDAATAAIEDKERTEAAAKIADERAAAKAKEKVAKKAEPKKKPSVKKIKADNPLDVV